MDKENHSAVTNEDLRKAFEGERASTPKLKKQKLSDKKLLIMLISGIVGCIGGAAMIVLACIIMNQDKAMVFGEAENADEEEVAYSDLTGEELADKNLKTAPVFCVQTPNGTDGARPQSGMNDAGVVFEAIAEAGITRFAAIYQDPTAAIIGPIRSLRLYYLEWDTPFDCTIVHAGGADDALAAVSSGKYKDLSEDYSYMYRGTHSERRWNNLFTTAANLKKFSKEHSYDTSNVKGFARMTPEESGKARAEGTAAEILNITKPAEGNTSETMPQVASIALRFSNSATYNVNYTYDDQTNTYLRSYQNGSPHEVYVCPEEDLGEKDPEAVCELKQLAPSVVVAIKVPERKAADNYHENIDVIGSGEAYIFQNGMAIEGTWKKPTREDQIKFTDKDGNEIKLAPGQTFVSAVPNYGSVDF